MENHVLKQYDKMLGNLITDKFSRDDYFTRQFYPKYRTEGYQVYWINDSTHKSLEDGYIGVAPLCRYNIIRRYEIEQWYYIAIGDHLIGREKLMKKLLAKDVKICYNVLYANLTLEKAKAYERFLRPTDNYFGEKHNPSNWNIKKGGS